MDVAVLFLGAPNLSSRRSVPRDVPVFESSPENVLAAVAAVDARQLLIVEPQGYAGPSTYAAALSLDADGGILGGCQVEADGTRRFGAVFASVRFGPYDVEPFPLIDPRGKNALQQPQRNAIDVVCPGVYLVDRTALIEVGGIDPTLESPWRVYDLCMRMRAAGKSVRWDPRLTFSVEIGVVRPIEAVNRRNFIRRWSQALEPRFDLETPVRGAIRRTLRTPMGQREVVMVPLPPTEVILYGDGALSPSDLRSTTRAQRVSVTDARGDEARSMRALRDALDTRADRYVALVDSTKTPRSGWLEQMLVQLESRPNARGVCEEGCALLAVSRIPFDMNPGPDERSVQQAVARLLRPRAAAGRTLSIVLVAHTRADVHRTSFEGIYGGELDVDYHAVVSASKPDLVKLLKSHATLDVLVDESQGLAKGINAALKRCTGEIVIVIGDDFYPPSGWFEIVREAFTLRPEMGILGFSSVHVEGPQSVDLAYADIKAFKALAQGRRAAMTRDAKLTDRLTALDFAIDARALRSVGGLDPKLGAGRFGIEDLTLRVRRAGYEAYVAEDLFLHHFEREMAEALLGNPQEEARAARVFGDKWKTRPDYVPARDAVALA